MSKQSSRQCVWEDQRREKQQHGEEERRHAMYTKRIMNIADVAAGMLVFAAIAYLMNVQRHTPVNLAYPGVDGVSCDGGEHGDIHIHAHITIYT